MPSKTLIRKNSRTLIHEDREKACEDGRTSIETRCGIDFEECQACGTSIRWDLKDHPFWGFQNCEAKQKAKE